MHSNNIKENQNESSEYFQASNGIWRRVDGFDFTVLKYRKFKTFQGWIHIKTVILRNALLSMFSKNIKQLTYAGCKSEIPPNSSRFRMNRKYCYQSATKFSTMFRIGVEVYFSRIGALGCGGLLTVKN